MMFIIEMHMRIMGAVGNEMQNSRYIKENQEMIHSYISSTLSTEVVVAEGIKLIKVAAAPLPAQLWNFVGSPNCLLDLQTLNSSSPPPAAAASSGWGGVGSIALKLENCKNLV